MNTTQCSILIVLMAGVCGTQVLADPPLYHVTDMEPALVELYPNQPYLNSQFFGLNENGDAVGEVRADSGLTVDGFIFTFEHGVVQLPLIPGYPRVAVRDVTDRDENGEVIIVGQGRNLTAFTAAVWRFSTVTGEVLETRDVGNLAGYTEGGLDAISNSGMAVGHQGDWVFQTVIKYNVHTGVLEELDFPILPRAINNLDQIVGGPYIGDLDGNYTTLPIPPDTTGYGLNDINDLGWVVGNAGRPYSDGAGRTLASWVRHTDAGWTVPSPGTPWDTGFAINNLGDITIGYGRGWDGGFYLDATAEEFWLNETMPPENQSRFDFDLAYAINDNQQVAASSVHAVLLTPVGRMIIPGDVNGDVQVNLDDHCSWLANPIDLDGDGDADAEDELWLIDRMAIFGFFIQDCNGNGLSDHCDITNGLSNDCNGNDIPDECEDDCNGDGVPDSCEPDCNGNGIPDACDIANGTSDDCNGNGIPDECDGGRTIEEMRVFEELYPIYKNAEFTSEIEIFEKGLVDDLDFTIDLLYRIGDLGVRLSHNGVTITLIDRPGYPNDSFLGNGQLGYDIILDDEGTGGGIEDEGNFGSPFEPIVSPPSFTPNDPLAAFNGMPITGVWTATVFTSDRESPPLAREWHDWGLTITTAPEDVPTDCGCPADFTGDGTLDFFDVSAFLDAFSAHDPAADLNGDGVFDFFDVSAYLQEFAAGCS
jgi:hypothetical protein